MLFEELRTYWLRKKFKGAAIASSVAVTLATLLFVFGWYGESAAFILGIPVFLFAVNRLLLLLKTKKLLQNIATSDFYKMAIKEGDDLKKLLSQISGELKEGCSYERGALYITPNWLLDFQPTDAKVIHMDQIIWMYRVDHRGSHSYAQCHLVDGSTYVFGVGEVVKMLQAIQQHNPQILYGYSNKIEMLMEENEQVFIKNIKKGKFPTMLGTWD